jgi:hypothetical protein
MLSGGVRSLEKAMENIFPGGIRSRMTYWWRASPCDSQSACAQQARALIKLISQDIEKHFCGFETGSDVPIISKQCRDSVFTLMDECGNDNHFFLSRHKCNAIALLTIEEALLQVHIGMTSAHEVPMKEKLIKVLQGLQLNLSNASIFSSTIDIPCIAEKLELKKLQHTGRGMEYLKLLSKQNSSSCLKVLSSSKSGLNGQSMY